MFPHLDLSEIDNGSLNIDTLEAIYARRSIRKYTKKLGYWELVAELLKAAMSAQSTVNTSPGSS
jgi:nitroreductase